MFTVIHDEPFPLPRYSGNGDFQSVAAAAQKNDVT
jgi:hypothetical protein